MVSRRQSPTFDRAPNVILGYEKIVRLGAFAARPGKKTIPIEKNTKPTIGESALSFA
jgi:hypothetical protein